MIVPVVLLIMVGIFEVGRAYQTWQVLTNAAREGARVAVLPGSNKTTVEAVVQQYMRDGQLGNHANAAVTVNQAASLVVNGTAMGASQVTVTTRSSSWCSSRWRGWSSRTRRRDRHSRCGQRR